MRITFAQGCYPRRAGGGHRVVYTYANNLAARGHQVTIVHPHSHWSDPAIPGVYHRLRGLVRNASIRIFPPRFRWQPVDGRVEMRYVPELRDRFFPDADAVFATVWGTAFDVNDLPPAKGEKFYLVQHYEALVGPKEKVDRTWHMPLHKVVVSKWLLELGHNLGCTDPVYIPNAVDHSHFRITTPIGNRPRKIASLYSPLDWKGAPEAVRALQAAKGRFPELRATFYGIARRRPDTLPPWADYCSNPSLSQLADRILNGSSVFLSASWYEGWPLAPAEAMACGCAVVTTDSRGVLEYCEDNVSALVSRRRDPEALSENLIRLLEDDELRIRIATAGNERIKGFVWERSTDMLETFVSTSIARARAGALAAPSGQL